MKHEKIRVHTLSINPSGEGGLTQESVVLSYQIVVIDRQRLIRKLGTLSPNYLLMLKVALDYNAVRISNFLLPFGLEKG
ncbi:MAG: type II toxin-antitoxin system PemK/MazF family toxin [Nostoc sp.]|uniref:type II toxin-antitoxin system PemK/MazF family toxin n=1 Tax=Nostoc sp. TaxID=1180 RepID=UPI002FF6F197